MKHSFSLSLNTQYQAFEAAATKCATVILLEHSVIKAERFPPPPTPLHWHVAWATRKIAWYLHKSYWNRWCSNIIFLPAVADSSWEPHLPLHTGRPPVVRGNLALRCEENHFPCLHEYRSPTPQKTLWYWFSCLYTLPKSFIHYWQRC